MAQIEILVAGRRHEISCRDGDQDNVRTLAEMIDARAADAVRMMGGMGEARQLLFAALMLADQLQEAKAKAESAANAPPPPVDPVPPAPAIDAEVADALERFADRLEAAAARLEKAGISA